MTRLGLIGLGKQGQRYLDPRNGGGSVVALQRHSYTNEVSLTDLQNVDAVIIATPAETHADIAIRCLEAGKPVLVEKPLATTLADCMSVIDTAERLGLPLLVGHTHLFSENWQPRPGKPSSIESFFYGDCKLPAWLDWGPHVVAMAIDAMGGPPEYGTFERALNGRHAEWQLEFSGERVANVRCSLDSNRLRKFIAWTDPGEFEKSRWQYDPDAPCEHTALWHQVETFKRLVAGGHDRRATYNFTRAVYRTVFGELT